MPIQSKIRPVVRSIIGKLVDSGHEAFIVGGAVRDLLLDIEPKDYDIATSASPEDVRRVFGSRRSRIIGRRFRLVHVYAHGEVYEVSTFRREPTPEERRGRMDDDGLMIWRDNEYGTLEEDARRRDFTVNALYYDAVGDRGIIDFVGGWDDLRTRTARAIGEPGIRLDEDPVRILRALKLVGQFGFTPEPELGAQLREKADRITLASANRLFEELLKILATGKSLPILEAFREYGFLEHFWPGLDRSWSSEEGVVIRRMLAERDIRVAREGYSTSKALALATIALPHVIRRLGGNGDFRELWDHEAGLEGSCRGAVVDLMRPFPVSRFFSARMRDMMLLLPRFRDGIRRGKLVRHPEYKYGRELYSLLLSATDSDPSLLAEWPEAGESESSSPRSPRGGRRRRRSPRKTRNSS